MDVQCYYDSKKFVTASFVRLFLGFICFLLTPSLGGCLEQQLSNNKAEIQALSVLIGQKTVQTTLNDETLTIPRQAPEIIKTLQKIKPFNEKRFATPPAPPLKADVPRVAILLPLSGEHSELGQAMLNASQLALFHFADRAFELLPQDTKGSVSGALDAATLAIGDGAALILGPLFASSVEAVSPVARAAGIKIIAFSNDRTIAGEGVFTMGFLPGEQVQRVVTYAVRRGVKRFAVLAPSNNYGVTIADALKQTVEAHGAEVSEGVFYDPKTKDFNAVIKQLANYDVRRQALLTRRGILEARDDEFAKKAMKRLKNKQTLGEVSFEALLVAAGGKALQSIAALLPYYDIDPEKIKVLGTGQWDVAGIGSEPALVGAWFAAPASGGRIEFVRQFKNIYGKLPPRLSTLAYDATALAAVFANGAKKEDAEIEKYENNSVFTLLNIAAPQGFMGLDGVFRFLNTGVAERGLSIFQVRERDIKTIQLAPTSFESQID
jgi:ABC-type branched-subunit amino acid transport system substrate-binding protein